LQKSFSYKILKINPLNLPEDDIKKNFEKKDLEELHWNLSQFLNIKIYD
jgi:hypothetical protein